MVQVGLWIDAGSRYENERNNGTAHFLEHMAFKVRSSLTEIVVYIQCTVHKKKPNLSIIGHQEEVTA